MQNTFGTFFKVTTFGESHGNALGCVIDGIPAGIKIDSQKIQQALDKRKPGKKNNSESNSAITSRTENDTAQIISGVFNDFSLGTPLCIIIKNQNQNSFDYDELASIMRPGHADITYLQKYGFRDYRGGGRSSGRETCARVAAGEIARQVIEHLLKSSSFKTTAYTLRAAGIQCKKIDFSQIEKNPMRAPDKDAAQLMEQKIAELKEQGNSAGGIIECQITGVPSGLGNPVFDKLDALLAHAMLSIGSVKGIEFGKGFEVADLTGLSNNDSIEIISNHINYKTNNSGGILGGISNGDTILFRIAVKPVPSIFAKQKTIRLKTNPDLPLNKSNFEFENTEVQIKGRHDVCLCPRIVPVVEAMTNIVVADLLLSNNCID